MTFPENFIVITSINYPNQAIIEFAKWVNWQVVVVGDRKTPPTWSCDSVIFLSIEKQDAEFGEFARALPENTYVRKMLGYVYAIRHGAKAIFESDDDNISYPNVATICKISF